jgi:hypothetical protein
MLHKTQCRIQFFFFFFFIELSSSTLLLLLLLGESTLYFPNVSTYWQFDAQYLKIGK